MRIKFYNDDKNNYLYFPKALIEKNDIIPHRLILNIGNWQQEVEVKIDQELDKDSIGFSNDLFKEFTLPKDISYDVILDKRNIKIGPVIAFLAVSNKNSLTPETLEKLQEFFIYKKIKGLVYICSADSINISSKSISGYYFNPNAQEHENPWKFGKFPYPGAMYRRAGLSNEVYNHLISQMGDKIFNSYFFNKLELWKWLSNYPNIKEYLPYTEKLSDLDQIDKLLSKYQTLYLKKVAGHKAKGIIMLEKPNKSYHFIYRLKKEVVIKNHEDAAAYIKSFNKNKDYIVQQAIKIKKHENRNCDFRVILQKNREKQWVSSGVIARFGKEGSIATNFLLDGYALPGEEALIKVFKISEKNALKKQQEMINKSIEVCKILDHCAGNYGDLGIDLIVDSEQKVWLLEINKLHDPRFPLYSIDDEKMYEKVMTRPFEYAKTLTGF